MIHPVWIGGDTYINGDLIISITNATHPKSKKAIKAAKEEGKLLDYTAGLTRKAVIMLNDGHVVVACVIPSRIVEEIKKEEKCL